MNHDLLTYITAALAAGTFAGVGAAALLFQRWSQARKALVAAQGNLSSCQQQSALIKRDFDRTQAVARKLEGERDQMMGQVETAESKVASLEAQRDAQLRELERMRTDIAERPKLKTQVYKIVVIGMRSTGKTSLILKWANPIWEVRKPPGATLFNKFSRTVSSVLSGKSNVVVDHVFEIFDFGGERIVEAQETLVVDDIHGLLFVVDLGQEGAEQVDDARIQSQIQAFSLQALQFFFRAPRIVKSCQTVVLFINKSDLLSGTPSEVEKMARARYAPLIQAIESFAEQVQIEVMVGSSYSGHNTHRLMPHFIQKLLPEDAYDEQLLQRAQGQL